MNMKDMHSHMDMAVGIAAAALAADTTPPTVDLQGFLGAEIALNVGVGGITFSPTNKIEFKLQHSDDDSTYADVTDDDVLGVSGISDGILKALVAAHPAAAVYRFGYVGGKRYLQLRADFSGTHGAATPIAGTVIRGRPTQTPTGDQA